VETTEEDATILLSTVYGIGNPREILRIDNGDWNIIFRVTPDESWILRISHHRKAKPQLEFEMRLLRRLSESGAAGTVVFMLEILTAGAQNPVLVKLGKIISMEKEKYAGAAEIAFQDRARLAKKERKAVYRELLTELRDRNRAGDIEYFGGTPAASHVTLRKDTTGMHKDFRKSAFRQLSVSTEFSPSDTRLPNGCGYRREGQCERRG